MKKLIVLALLVAAGWYGYKNYPELLSRTPSHEAVIVNGTGDEVTRVRLIVDGQTFVKESIASEAKARFPFKVTQDASFELAWQWGSRSGERRWSGGTVFKGPVVARHTFTIQDDGGVVYESGHKGGAL